MANPMSQSPNDLLQEVDHGASGRTPFIALTGVTVVIASVVVLILIVLFLLYYLV
jgi:hypothetical protein